MFSDKDWVAIFKNDEIKKDLITLACSYFQAVES